MPTITQTSFFQLHNDEEPIEHTAALQLQNFFNLLNNDEDPITAIIEKNLAFKIYEHKLTLLNALTAELNLKTETDLFIQLNNWLSNIEQTHVDAKTYLEQKKTEYQQSVHADSSNQDAQILVDYIVYLNEQHEQHQASSFSQQPFLLFLQQTRETMQESIIQYTCDLLETAEIIPFLIDWESIYFDSSTRPSSTTAITDQSFAFLNTNSMLKQRIDEGYDLSRLPNQQILTDLVSNNKIDQLTQHTRQHFNQTLFHAELYELYLTLQPLNPADILEITDGLAIAFEKQEDNWFIHSRDQDRFHKAHLVSDSRHIAILENIRINEETAATRENRDSEFITHQKIYPQSEKKIAELKTIIKEYRCQTGLALYPFDRPQLSETATNAITQWIQFIHHAEENPATLFTTQSEELAVNISEQKKALEIELEKLAIHVFSNLHALKSLLAPYINDSSATWSTLNQQLIDMQQACTLHCASQITERIKKSLPFRTILLTKQDRSWALTLNTKPVETIIDINRIAGLSTLLRQHQNKTPEQLNTHKTVREDIRRLVITQLMSALTTSESITTILAQQKSAFDLYCYMTNIEGTDHPTHTANFIQEALMIQCLLCTHLPTDTSATTSLPSLDTLAQLKQLALSKAPEGQCDRLNFFSKINRWLTELQQTTEIRTAFDAKNLVQIHLQQQLRTLLTHPKFHYAQFKNLPAQTQRTAGQSPTSELEVHHLFHQVVTQCNLSLIIADENNKKWLEGMLLTLLYQVALQTTETCIVSSEKKLMNTFFTYVLAEIKKLCSSEIILAYLHYLTTLNEAHRFTLPAELTDHLLPSIQLNNILRQAEKVSEAFKDFSTKMPTNQRRQYLLPSHVKLMTEIIRQNNRVVISLNDKTIMRIQTVLQDCTEILRTIVPLYQLHQACYQLYQFCIAEQKKEDALPGCSIWTQRAEKKELYARCAQVLRPLHENDLSQLLKAITDKVARLNALSLMVPLNELRQTLLNASNLSSDLLPIKETQLEEREKRAFSRMIDKVITQLRKLPPLPDSKVCAKLKEILETAAQIEPKFRDLSTRLFSQKIQCCSTEVVMRAIGARPSSTA